MQSGVGSLCGEIRDFMQGLSSLRDVSHSIEKINGPAFCIVPWLAEMLLSSCSRKSMISPKHDSTRHKAKVPRISDVLPYYAGHQGVYHT